MYPILYRLEDDGMITSQWSVPKDKEVSKKYYVITPEGERTLENLLISGKDTNRLSAGYWRSSDDKTGIY